MAQNTGINRQELDHVFGDTHCSGHTMFGHGAKENKGVTQAFPILYNIHVYLYIHIDRWIGIDSDFVALTFDAVQSSKLTKSNVESGLMKKEPRTLAMV